MPLGTITRLSSKYTESDDIKVGSLSSLYESVVNLDVVHFLKEAYKDLLVNPRNSSHVLCRKLKVDLNTCVSGIDADEVFLKKKGLFIITDDLYVRPFMLDNSIQLLKTLGGRDGKYLKSEAIRTKLLYPKIAANYYHVTGFLKEQETFIVSDNLEISLSPSISTISKFTVGVSLSDIEVREVCIDELEVKLEFHNLVYLS
ncbi:hypothetical protein Tco_1137880 [Tanacetum coccineum]